MPFVINRAHEKCSVDVSTRLKDAAADSIDGYLRIKAVKNRNRKIILIFFALLRLEDVGPKALKPLNMGINERLRFYI